MSQSTHSAEAMSAEDPFKTWTPELYEKLHASLTHISEGIEVPINQLAELLETCFPVFSNVLQNPAPSEDDRKKLQNQTLTLGDFEYKTNSEFRQCVENVSMAVNLNELYAAKIVILALPQAQRFDRNQTETAVYLYYSRRQYLLASLLKVIRFLADLPFEDYIGKFFLDYVTRLSHVGIGDTKSFPVRLVQAMKSGRDDIVKLDEIQRNRSLLRDNKETYSDEDIRVRKKLVAQEIDTMGLILHGLVRLKFVKEKDIEEILRELKAAEKLDVLSASLISPVVSWLCQLCSMDDNITVNTPTPALPPFNGPALKRIHNLIVVKPPLNWKILSLGAYIQLYWLSALNGICKLEDGAAVEFTYERDILEPAQSAAKTGGFDFAISDVLRPARSGTFTPAIRPLVASFLATRKFPVLLANNVETLFISQDSRDLSTYQLEHLVQLFISHLADVLKQIRLVEEDKALAEGSLFDYSEQSLQQNNEERDYSLEVFFLLISQLYSNRPDAGEVFLTDPDSALFGFLNWASGVKPVSMLWTFLDLIASLAEGPNSSVAINNLFSQDTSDQPRSKRFHQSWDLIFGAIQYYAENLSPPPAGNASIGRTPVAYDRLEIDDETTIVLKTYLRLIRNVAANSHDAKITLLSRNEDRVLSHIFELTINRLATDLKAEIWLTLTAFAKDDESIITEIWEGLDLRLQQYIERIQNQRTFFNVPVITRQSTFKDINLVTLDITSPDATSPEEYAAFLELLATLVEVSSEDHPLHDILTFDENLGDKYRIPGVHPFVNFVLQLFPTALSSVPLDIDSRSILISKCLEFLYQSLNSFNPDLIKFANVTGLNIDTAISASSLKSYITLHPGSLIMTHILDDRILSPILETLNIPIERLNDEPKTSPVAISVLRSLQVINAVLDWQQMFMDVVEPSIRDHLQIVTGQDLHSLRHTSLKTIESRILSRVPSVNQIALFVNAEDSEIAMLAVRTLDRLAAFARGNIAGGVTAMEIPRRNRLLEIIRNSKDSKRILFGVMNKLEEVDQEEALVPFESKSLKQKRALLSLLRKDLIDSPEVPSVAHFLLGYSITEGGGLELGQEKGNIGSDVSVLKTVFALVDPLEDEVLSATVSGRNPIETMSRDLSTSELALEIVVRLCQATLSGAITTTVLRQDAVFLQQFSSETSIFPNLLNAIEATLRENGSALGLSSIACSSIRRKTWLLRYLANELHIFAAQKAFSSLRAMTEYLIGKKQDSHGFQALFDPQVNQGRRLLAFFDQVIINVGSFDDIDFSSFGEAYSKVDWGSCRAEPRPAYFESDVQQVSELILLKTQEVLSTPPAKDEKVQQGLFEEGKHVVETFVDRNVVQEMTWAVGECLEAWSELFTVILEEGLKTVEKPIPDDFINESVRILALRFADNTFVSSPHADSLSYILFTLIEKMQESASIGTRGGILDLLDPASDRFISFFGNILGAIVSSTHIQTVRENLYFVIYSCVTFAISYTAPPETKSMSGSTLRTTIKKFDASSFLSSLVQLSTTNGERFVDVLCHDSLMSDGTCKVTSTLLLGVLAESDVAAKLGVIPPILERRGFVKLFVPTIAEARLELEDAINAGEEYIGFVIIVEAKLSVLLEVSRTRSGATQILQSPFFEVFRGFSLTPDMLVHVQQSNESPRVVTRLRQLDILLQILSGLVISLGPQNPAVTKQIRSSLEWHEPTLQALFQAFVAHGENSQDHALAPAIWQVVTLLDNLRELVGEANKSS